MAAEVWTNYIVGIYFIYGLAFYSMGLGLMIESGRSSELGFARSMRLLAAFGILHGVHEWLDMLDKEFTLFHGEVLPEWTAWVRVILLVTSFLALVAFGEHLLTRELRGRDPSWYLVMALTAVFVISCVLVRVVYRLDDQAWMAAIDVLSRYITGIPGALVACWALWRQRAVFRAQGMGRFERDLVWGALALALYGVIGQVFTRPSEVFPSMYINSQLFMGIFGFPVQLFRATMAVVVAVAMINVLRVLEMERQLRLDVAERAAIEVERRNHQKLEQLNANLQAANEETARLLEKMQKRDALRQEYVQRTTVALEDERKRIARELHDDTGQRLTGLALGLRGLSQQQHAKCDASPDKFSELELMATEALDTLRNLINDLRPPQLDDMGLYSALRFMVKRMMEREEIEVDVTVTGHRQQLPSEVETTLFRIAQEGLTNVLKHAKASHVTISLDYNEGVTLKVCDDGIGFDLEEMLSPDATRTAWGLIGIEERAHLIDAELTIKSAPGEGTSLVVHLDSATVAGYERVMA